MRAISQYRNYNGPVAQAEQEMVLANGLRSVIAKELSASPFRHGDTTEWERAEARKAWPNMQGLTVDEDPVHRLSSFDTVEAAATKGWTDEEREKVEQALLRGATSGDYIIVSKPELAPPWPAYPKLVAQGARTIEKVAATIAAKTAEDGYDPEHVLAYEREHLNRPDVVTALEALVNTPAGPAEDPLIAA